VVRRFPWWFCGLGGCWLLAGCQTVLGFDGPPEARTEPVAGDPCSDGAVTCVNQRLHACEQGRIQLTDCSSTGQLCSESQKACVDCLADADCKAEGTGVDPACVASISCEAGKCVVKPVVDGLLADDDASDCSRQQCSGGQLLTRNDDQRSASCDGAVLTRCVNQTFSHTTCEGDTPVCDAVSGRCVACLSDGDCPLPAGLDAACVRLSCSANHCLQENVAQAPPDPDPTDCRLPVCVAGALQQANDDSREPFCEGSTLRQCAGGELGSISCEGATTRCDAPHRRCAECLTDADCLQGYDLVCLQSSPTCGASGVCQRLANDAAIPEDSSKSDCVKPACQGGKIIMVADAQGQPVDATPAKDCKKTGCDGASLATAVVADPGDLPDDGNPCTDDICQGDQPAHTPKPEHHAVGGQECDGVGSLRERKSCKSLPQGGATCGYHTGNHHCCEAVSLPGGSFHEWRDDKEAIAAASGQGSHLAQIDPFQMDAFEVTRGRFRQFLNAYDDWRSSGLPKDGDGADVLLTSLESGDSNFAGWHKEWNHWGATPGEQFLPDNKQQFIASISAPPYCDYWAKQDSQGVVTEPGDELFALGADPTVLGGRDSKPATCVNWYMAFAFCIWDGGRLPTAAEWSYAFSGGSEQRLLPWSTPGAASSDLTAELGKADVCSGQGANDPFPSACPVAISFAGLGGKISSGHLDVTPSGIFDMAGNATEWVRDDVAAGYASGVCKNCVHLSPNLTAERSYRGGNFLNNKITLSAGIPFALIPSGVAYSATEMDITYGFRCARRPHAP
jgi:formylglycine-generating enzyme required for sulfatase activity